jgi:tetratricopeptide (TPR) repeat protein
LYTHDVNHLSESAKVHAIIANTYYPRVAKEFKKNPNNPNLGKDIQKVIYHYKEAIRIDSTYYTSLNNLGSVYLNFNRDFNTAIKYCAKALKYDSNYVEAHFNTAFSYNSLGNYDKTIFHIKRIIEIDPSYLRAYDLLNQTVVKNKKEQEGIKMLDDLALESENSKPIYLNIGNLYSLMGESYYPVALDYFIKASSASSDTSDVALCHHIVKLASRLGRTDIVEKYGKDCK